MKEMFVKTLKALKTTEIFQVLNRTSQTFLSNKKRCYDKNSDLVWVLNGRRQPPSQAFISTPQGAVFGVGR